MYKKQFCLARAEFAQPPRIVFPANGKAQQLATSTKSLKEPSLTKLRRPSHRRHYYRHLVNFALAMVAALTSGASVLYLMHQTPANLENLAVVSKRLTHDTLRSATNRQNLKIDAGTTIAQPTTPKTNNDAATIGKIPEESKLAISVQLPENDVPANTADTALATTIASPPVENQDDQPSTPPTSTPTENQPAQGITDSLPSDRLPTNTPSRTVREAFTQLNKMASAPVPAEIASLIATYRDEQNKTRLTRLRRLEEIGTHGSKAAAAIPFLHEQLLERDVEKRAVVFRVLKNIGQPAVPTLIVILEGMKKPKEFESDNVSPRDKLAYHAISCLGQIGQDAKIASPVLLDLSVQSSAVFHYRQCFSEPGTSSANYQKTSPKKTTDKGFQAPDATYFDKEALLALRALQADPKEITPGLVKLLATNTDRLVELERIKKQKRISDALANNLKRHMGEQCATALLMLSEASPPSIPKKVVPPVCALLERGIAKRESINLLGRLGPNAKDALSLLRSQLTNQELGLPAEEAIALILRE